MLSLPKYVILWDMQYAKFGIMPTYEELKVSFKGGYNALVERRKANEANTSTANKEVYKLDAFWLNT